MYLMLSWNAHVGLDAAAVREEICQVLNAYTRNVIEPMGQMGRCMLCNIKDAGTASQLQDEMRALRTFSFTFVYCGKGHWIWHSADIDSDKLREICDYSWSSEDP